MEQVKPEVYLVSQTLINWEELDEYFGSVGTSEFGLLGVNDTQDLVETAGRLCYRSWEPGLNKNVTRVRKDQEEYIENILRSGHGSVLEHVSFGFIFRNVSRVFTHEMVRHRTGSAFSQESLRYVRLDELKFWFPDWMRDDEWEDLKEVLDDYLREAERLQSYMSVRFGLDQPGVSFHEKKSKTSFMRRFAPEGLATDIMWTGNIRTLRHVIESRTADGAEEEMRLVFGEVARQCVAEAPYLFQDFTELESGAWVPQYRKV
jgi:thymidylate synthase (FAD)